MKMKRGASSFSVVAILFISIIAIMFAIYGSSGKQYETIQGATTVTSLTNAQVGQVTQGQDFIATGSSTTTTTASNTTSNNIACTPTYNPFYLFCVIDQLGTYAYCDLTALIGTPCSESTVNNAVTGSSNPFSSNSGGSLTAVYDNSLVKLASTPFGQAMIVLGVFLALGILAGLLGAGILARVMALAGLALSIIIYIEGQLTSFTGLPDYIWWLVNGIFTAIMVIIVWEAFDSGGVG
jgi:hypothetical protein